ncbi:hypothetical protein JX265_001783 [Neoarthrinium moseri]|uniref:Uncharacterized protein n=1 Tax=Neoarthrinium moseri TaxID=1658444 RepID=A0A9P9WVZ2_9PEZI|nr:uncharacterized protein JN550_005362 [Neoarthrinium moseri]KAI1842369.1 hypothetical protein JX266_011410 [Neoarthrinium moseri]KAI1870434.1 hypothetical protein JN550_005362 [Neoarthrinium moseri]KAI1880162.1 hypothetical protein JX265_001783 [Neoarthrinium moseri]
MHPFSVVTLAIFVAGYGTARWDLVTRLYELALFAWDKGVICRSAQGFGLLTLLFLVVLLPVQHLARQEAELLTKDSPMLQHPRSPSAGVSAREQLRRRGSF